MTSLIWANLNDEGKKIFGGIFKEGKVPIMVQSALAHSGELGDLGEVKFHMVNLALIDSHTKNLLFQTLAKRFDIPINKLQKEVMANGLPLRASLVSSIGLDRRVL